MFESALTWILIVGAAAAGLFFGGQPSLRGNLDTVTTLVVVGLLAQWMFGRNPGFRAGKFWTAVFAAGFAMIGLRWLVYR